MTELIIVVLIAGLTGLAGAVAWMDLVANPVGGFNE